MPKRSSDASVSSQPSAKTRAQKRAKVDESSASALPNAPEYVEESIEEEVREGAEEEVGENDAVQSVIHDPKYYFEDGSVIFRIRQVLFKVHTSLLRVHSEDFFKQLDLSPSDSKILGGASDEDAIVIPDIQPSQFRNLMKLVYCLPANNFVTRPATNNKESVVRNFDCYLDVALMSRKFAMEDIEQWAKNQLGELLHKAGKDLVIGFRTFGNLSTIKPDDLEVEDDVDIPHPAYYCNAFRFLEAIGYAKAVSDDSLLHDTLSALQFHLVGPSTLIEALISYFRIENLCETNPSLFGFLFLLLLQHGNQVWIWDMFTQADRVALFSAQSFLTPLPNSLKASILTPFFKQPTCADDLIGLLSDNAAAVDKCHEEFFSQWEDMFPPAYYENVNSMEFLVSIKALTTLPLRRLNLGVRLRRPRYKCKPCYHKFLGQFDRDMQKVFTRLGRYYQVYE